MSRATMEEKFCAALRARGESLLREGKHKVFSRTRTIKEGKPVEDGGLSRYFVGSSGSVRVGKASRGSLPLNKACKSLLLAEGEALLKK